MNDKRVRFSDSLEDRLCKAIEDQDVSAAKSLCKLGAKVNSLMNNGITPMHWACGIGDTIENLNIVKVFLSEGGNPNVKSIDGVTPVHVAASWGFLTILQTLIAHGGDPWTEDQENCNAWDLALQKNQWLILKFLASYMEEEPNEEPPQNSVMCVFVRQKEVDVPSLSNSSVHSNNIAFLGLDSTLSCSSSNPLNLAMCNSLDTTITPANTSSSIIVEEHVYTDREKGVDLIEWHYPPIVKQESVVDATLNDALCTSSEEKDWTIESQQLFEELRTLGTTPGPITPTTKQVYLRQLYRLRKEKAIPVHSPQKVGSSKELLALTQSYPGPENDIRIAFHLDRLFVTHFTCPDPLKPWREGLSKKSFNYLLLDPRITHNLPLNESQDQANLFRRFVSSIFYIGKGKQTRPHEHLYEAVKLRHRNVAFFKVSKKVRQILKIWEEGHGVVSIHVFQNSLPVEAFCREAAMIEAIGISSLTNIKRGDYYGICTTWTDSERRLWGSHLLYKAFHIFLHEGERQIRPVDL